MRKRYRVEKEVNGGWLCVGAYNQRKAAERWLARFKQVYPDQKFILWDREAEVVVLE